MGGAAGGRPLPRGVGMSPNCGHTSFIAGPQSHSIVFLVRRDKQVCSAATAPFAAGRATACSP